METASFYDYLVYEDGRVWSNKRHLFLKPDVQKLGYLQVTLFINGVSKRYKVHRLVALCFIPNPDNLPQINHKDGNKQNNHVSNLEWCTAYHNNKHARENGLNDISKSNLKRWTEPEFKSRVSKRISEGRRASGDYSGENNPSFRYRIECGGKRMTVKELQRLLGCSESNTYAIIRKAVNGKRVQMLVDNDVHITDIKKSQSTIESVV